MLYDAVLLLYNKVNQLYVYIYPHIPSLLRLPPTFPIPPLQVDTKHGVDLEVREWHGHIYTTIYLFIQFFILIWTYGYLFYTLCYNLILC